MRLIDADALKERYYESMKELLKATGAAEITDNAVSLLCGSSLIIDAPTIEAEPVRHGKWITAWYDSRPLCSECGKFGDERTDYCPNCGAKMEDNIE